MIYPHFFITHLLLTSSIYRSNESHTGFSIVRRNERPKKMLPAESSRAKIMQTVTLHGPYRSATKVKIIRQLPTTNTARGKIFYDPTIFSAGKCAKTKIMSIFALLKSRFKGPRSRRDAGVVDRAALEMRCTGNCTGGSNPSLSAEQAQGDRLQTNVCSFFVSEHTAQPASCDNPEVARHL